MIAENNSEFRSNRQQDAEEYLQFLLDRLTKEEPKFTNKVTSDIFNYKLTNRLVCQGCQNYKLVDEKTNLWKFPVPPPSKQDIDAFYENVANLKDENIRKAKAC